MKKITGLRYDTVDDLFLVVGDGATDLASLKALETAMITFGDARGKKALMLWVSVPGKSNRFEGATPDVRAYAPGFVTRSSASFTAAALAITVEGFLGASIRALFSTIVLAARFSTPLKILREPTEAMGWLRSHLPSGKVPTDLELRMAIDRLEAGT